MTPDLPTRDLLTLQRMAFEITLGLLHLHENNYIHRWDMKVPLFIRNAFNQTSVLDLNQLATSFLSHQKFCVFLCSDLALRNCLLTSDLTVRIGDYGLSHNHYKVQWPYFPLKNIFSCKFHHVGNCYPCVHMKEDYYLTPDKLWIPLRWIAPELLEEYRGSLIVTDQTKTSNVWYVFNFLCF